MSIEQTESNGKANLSVAIKKGFRDAYDHLGLTLAVSLITSFVFVILSSLARLSFFSRPVYQVSIIIVSSLCAWLCASGAYYFVGKSVYGEHPVLIDFWLGFKRTLTPSIKLYFVDLLITAAALSNIIMFVKLALANSSFSFFIISAFASGITIIWLMMLMYHLPLLVWQLEQESGPGALVILRKSFLLVAGNPAFTVGLFLVIIAFTIICVFSALIGWVTLFLGASAFLLTHATRNLFIKYGIVEDDPEPDLEDKWKLPESWRKRAK